MTIGRGRTALVTGASSGIGTALATELARDGFDLILTARRTRRLEELKAELESRFGIAATVITADLSDPAAPQALFDEVREAEIAVDVLVNNAGYGMPLNYLDVEWQAHADFIQVLVTAVCNLSHLFLPGMVERRYGRIINIASVAGLLPGSGGHTLYSAAKSFIIKMSEALSQEHADDNVHVTAVCPGLTYSEFHDVAGTREKASKISQVMWMDADTVARQAVDAVMRGDAVLINGVPNQVVAGLFKYLPRRAGWKLAGRAQATTRD